MLPKIIEILKDLLAVLWPTQCVGCGAEDRDFCNSCAEQLFTAAQQKTIELRTNPKCFAAGEYEEALKALIVGVKHGGRVGFAKPLGKVLATAVEKAAMNVTGPVILVPVPSRKKRVRERGYVHLELIAKHCIKFLRDPQKFIVLRALQPLRGRTGQVGLDIKERALNAAKIKVDNNFLRFVKSRNVIVIDDVLTTGATISAAVAALEAAGASVVASATISHAVKRSDKAMQRLASRGLAHNENAE